MIIKALILDLDNTIFPVPSIGSVLFAPLFDLIGQRVDDPSKIDGIRKDTMRIPFQKVAVKYELDEALTNDGIELLKTIEHRGPITAFDDFSLVRDWDGLKFLVTMGFEKMQSSKIDALHLRDDFEKVYIADPSVTDKTKKDIFADILLEYQLKPEEVMVVGDDPESEIRGAEELNIPAVIYDKYGTVKKGAQQRSISDYSELLQLIGATSR